MINMRKRLSVFITVLIFLILIISITSCGKPTSNGLMEGASPDTSALAVYYYNGEKVSCYYIYDSDITKNILNELDAVKATEVENWSLKNITQPIYGLWITATDGSDIYAAWSNGYWISRTGTVYRFDFSFEDLEKKYLLSDKQEFLSFTHFPCARFLTQDESGWNSMLLTPAEELEPPDGVVMTLESWDQDTVKVNIANNKDSEWMYGEHYNLQLLLDGVWYEVPPMPGQWAFNDIGLIVRADERQNKTYDLTMYGELLPGTYRIVAYGLSVESII